MQTFKAIFNEIPDTRYKNAQYDLTEIILIALTAVLCGAESCTDIADYGRDKEDFLRHCLDLKHGIPSHDTFSRVFRVMDPEAFEKAFRKFIAEFSKALPKGSVAIDGKSIKSTFHSGQKHMPPMMVSAWATDLRLVLSRLKVENGNEKDVSVRLVSLLDIEGVAMTADALHLFPLASNRGFAQSVIDRGADYALTLKENQAKLPA